MDERVPILTGRWLHKCMKNWQPERPEACVGVRERVFTPMPCHSLRGKKDHICQGYQTDEPGWTSTHELIDDAAFLNQRCGTGTVTYRYRSSINGYVALQSLDPNTGTGRVRRLIWNCLKGGYRYRVKKLPVFKESYVDPPIRIKKNSCGSTKPTKKSPDMVPWDERRKRYRYRCL
jgi:hypothetical protein